MRAKRNHKTGLASLKRWFIQKYQLPPSHRLFEGRSESELTMEMLEDFYGRADALRQEAESLQGAGSEKQRDVLYEQLNRILGILGEPAEDYDPVIARWEAELKAGRVPNLSER